MTTYLMTSSAFCSDIISHIKCGATWLKKLLSSIRGAQTNKFIAMDTTTRVSD